MTTLITGVEGSLGTNAILAAQKVLDVSDKIYLLEPNAAPLYVLVSKLSKASAINPAFSWFEDELTPSWTTFAVSAVSGTSGSTTVITAANAYINQFDLLKVPSTGEVMLCTTVTSTAVTCIRGYGTTANASAAAAADILILGPAFAEGSLGTDLKTTSTVTEEKTNYCQLFRKSVELTRTLANTETYGGPERNLQRKKKGIELMRDFERMFLYGELKVDTTNAGSHARRTMKGINSFISTNYTNAGGTLTEAEFEGFLRTVFRYGGSSRYLFCSPLIISVISQWAQGKLQVFPKDKTYGVAITQYLSPQGSVNLVREYMLENAGGVSSSSYYAGYGFALALEELTYRYLQNRDVQLETDIQANGDDCYKDQYICEVSLEMHQEKMHGRLLGVTG